MLETVLAEQRKGIEELVTRGGRLCALHWELDGTPQNVTLQDPETIAALSGGITREAQDRRGCRDVLVQCGWIAADHGEDEIFCKPRILGDSSSTTHLDAVMQEMHDQGVGIQRLSGQFD